MPFYASKGGDAGHSALDSRRLFLKMTIESLRPTFPKYTVTVATEADAEFVANSGLGFDDVRKAFGLPKPAMLGFATVHETQRAVSSPRRASREGLSGPAALVWTRS